MHIVLYQPEIHFNAGNVGRTCVALGAKLWMVRPLGFHVDDKHLRRAGMDYWQHLDWEMVDDWSALLERLDDRPMWLLTKTAERLYTDVAFEPDPVLVFGRESSGLPPSLLEEHAARCLRIPMQPPARCLNLSVSVAVVAYEAQRQRSAEVAKGNSSQ